MNECLDKFLKKANGLISDQEAFKLLSDLERELEEGQITLLSPELTKEFPSRTLEAAGLMTKEAYVDKRNRLLNILAKENLKARFERFQTGLDKLPDWAKKTKLTNPVKEAVNSWFVGSHHLVEGSRQHAEASWKYTQKELIGDLYDELTKGELDTHFKNPENARSIAHELFNQSQTKGKGGSVTGSQDSYRVAQLVKKYFEISRERMNRAGAFINERADYIFSTSHSQEKIGIAGFDKWKQDILPLLDMKKTFQNLDDKAIEDYLRNSYEGLISGVHLTANAADEGNPNIVKSAGLGKRLSHARKLNFKDADSFMNYHEQYGEGTLPEIVFRSLDKAARDISLLETFGPSPEQNIFGTGGIFDSLKKENRTNPEMVKELNATKVHAQRLYDQLTGRANMSLNPSVTKWSNGIKNWNAIRLLNNVLLASLGDVPNKIADQEYIGIPYHEALKSGFGDLFKGYGDETYRQIANSYSAGYEGTLHTFLGSMGDMDASDPNANWFLRLTSSDNVQKMFKVFGLTYWTDAQKMGHAHAIAHFLGQNADRNYNDLKPELQRAFTIYDIQPKEWELIRQTVFEPGDKNPYIVPDKIAEIDDDSLRSVYGHNLSSDSLNRVRQELKRKLGVLGTDRVEMGGAYTPGAKTKTMFNQTGTRGTIFGEIVQHLFQFKSFPLGFAQDIIGINGREVAGRGFGTYTDRLDSSITASYIKLIGSMTLMGYLSDSMRSMARGESPKDPLNVNTLGAAFLRGGGLGLYGDFLFNKYDRFGRSFGSSMLGPSVGMVNDVMSLSSRVKDAMVGGDWGPAGEEGAQFVWRQASGYLNTGLIKVANPLAATSLLYMKGAADRMLYLQMMEQFNPGYIDRKERQMQEDFGQSFLF